MKCQAICLRKEQCKFFNWKKNEKDCFLLKDKQEENSSPDANSISGPKQCSMNDGKKYLYNKSFNISFLYYNSMCPKFINYKYAQINILESPTKTTSTIRTTSMSDAPPSTGMQIEVK